MHMIRSIVADEVESTMYVHALSFQLNLRCKISENKEPRFLILQSRWCNFEQSDDILYYQPI